ncbi:FecCD family ABC transporter permease [Paenibacillus pasadenensis]|uniref:ABC-type Fe3+-siderophore transport system, permease component n=1 Tax=Paenibacillus pasadenensis TaxID=217090 RepID=A0A2N5N066_9BACL|nr:MULTISPECIES: iron ABC transporter permease [Paenibacillus]PLT43702.1 ABC-type Fe3+-siderophore transport system, permease component [Paenibacillus pasadenensis]QGG54328.1 iron chelate uptake ABC transporter family permease subunit [Paenibacillus sp. B01]
MNSTGLPGAALKAAGLAAGAALLLLAFAANIMLGYTRVSLDDAWAAVTRYDETSMSQAVIRLTRLPRALIAAAVGASLAVAGVIMQAITRNPLASPSILGINSGAALAVVFALTVLRIESQTGLAWAAFGGAAAAAALVYGLSALGSDSLSPLRIVLAGAAMSALFASGTQGLLVRNQASLQDVLFWLSGSIAGRPLGILAAVAPYMLASMLAAWLLARHLNLLAAGEETAKGLGLRVPLVKLAGGAAIVLLAGGSVAVAGPIGFIGLVIPVVARFFSGLDHRWMVPYSMLLGAVLLLVADVAARYLIMPRELPVGVLTAAVGAPFFLYIARKRRRIA